MAAVRTASSSPRRLVMIGSGVCRRRALAPPVRGPYPHLEGGPVREGGDQLPDNHVASHVSDLVDGLDMWLEGPV